MAVDRHAAAVRLAVPPRRKERRRRTVRLRLTLWYGGLFFLSGAALLTITYVLVVQAFTAKTGPAAVCRRSGSGCHVITAGQARAAALHEHAAILHELLTRSAVALFVMAVLSIALGWFVAGRVLRPLRTITATARQISAANLGERLALNGPNDELKELGDTFDGLLARLEASFTAQRQFIANAAHELRTPLARQRVISQVALADPAASVESLRTAHERVLASGADQQQLIDALLALARGQAGMDRREPVDLAEVASQIVSARRSAADLSNLTVRLSLGTALAAGSHQLVEQLAVNLVDNALRHNLPGGLVDITTQTVNSCAVLSIANTGPAVPDAAVERLFQPFQRSGADRVGRGDGLGLGLSIVQAIADAHGASVTARPRPEGGLQIEVTFPDPSSH
jgi:signal transduction histidine kinase